MVYSSQHLSDFCEIINTSFADFFFACASTIMASTSAVFASTKSPTALPGLARNTGPTTANIRFVAASAKSTSYAFFNTSLMDVNSTTMQPFLYRVEAFVQAKPWFLPLVIGLCIATAIGLIILLLMWKFCKSPDRQKNVAPADGCCSVLKRKCCGSSREAPDFKHKVQTPADAGTSGDRSMADASASQTSLALPPPPPQILGRPPLAAISANDNKTAEAEDDAEPGRITGDGKPETPVYTFQSESVDATRGRPMSGRLPPIGQSKNLVSMGLTGADPNARRQPYTSVGAIGAGSRHASNALEGIPVIPIPPSNRRPLPPAPQGNSALENYWKMMKD